MSAEENAAEENAPPEDTGTVTTLGPYRVHPLADAFPLLEDDAFAALVADIKANKLREPIVVTHDRRTLVDGRNRYHACLDAGVVPEVETLPEDFTESQIADLVMSANLARRHLTVSQRAVIGLEIERARAEIIKVEEAERKRMFIQRGRNKTRANMPESQIDEDHDSSAEVAARSVGVSAKSIKNAKRIEREAPDLIPEIRDGKLTVNGAIRKLDERDAKAAQPVDSSTAWWNKRTKALVNETTTLKDLCKDIRERAERECGIPAEFRDASDAAAQELYDVALGLLATLET